MERLKHRSREPETIEETLGDGEGDGSLSPFVSMTSRGICCETRVERIIS